MKHMYLSEMSFIKRDLARVKRLVLFIPVITLVEMVVNGVSTHKVSHLEMATTKLLYA